MSFFKGLAGGLARGVEDALTLEDEKIERQTAEALKEFKSRVKDQKRNRLARQGKLEDAIGSITAQGYSLATAASLVKQNGIAGAKVIMDNGSRAFEAGVSREDYIKEIENATSPGALSKELSTVSQAAETLAFQAFPAISREEFSAPKAPFSGSIISPEDDQDPEYRAKMLERLSESGVLPEQAKPEFESIADSEFTINRDKVPTAIELKKLESDALLSPTEKLWAAYATGTAAQKAAAKATLSGMQTIKNNDALEELRNKFLDNTTTEEEKAAIAKQIQNFTDSALSDADRMKKFSDGVLSLTSRFKTAVDSQFSRNLSTLNVENLSSNAALLKQKQEPQKEQFTIDGRVSAAVEVGTQRHKELEAAYLKGRRARVVTLLNGQPNIPDLYRQQIEANLLPGDVVSEVVDPGADDDAAPVVAKEMIEIDKANSKEKFETANKIAVFVTEFKRKYPDATSDTIVVAATENEPAVTLGQLEAKVALAGATEPQEPVAVNDETTPLDAEAYIRIARDAISGGGDDDTVEARVKKELEKRLPPKDAAKLAGIWKLARYYKPSTAGLGGKKRGPQEEVAEETRRWSRSNIATAIKDLTGKAN